MKVQGPSPTRPAALGGGPRPAADGFRPAQESEGASSAAHAGALSAVGGLDALLALQDAETPLDRRRRAVRRGGRILDALDELRLAALGEDALDAPALHRLGAAVREARAGVDEPGLEDLLDQIEIRAAVELAKREARLPA